MKTSTQTIKYILTAITTAILTIAMTVFAAPFTPGQTLDPSCNPGDVDCYVEKNIETSNGLSINGVSGNIELGGVLNRDTSIQSNFDPTLFLNSTNADVDIFSLDFFGFQKKDTAIGLYGTNGYVESGATQNFGSQYVNTNDQTVYEVMVEKNKFNIDRPQDVHMSFYDIVNDYSIVSAIGNETGYARPVFVNTFDLTNSLGLRKTFRLTETELELDSGNQDFIIKTSAFNNNTATTGQVLTLQNDQDGLVEYQSMYELTTNWDTADRPTTPQTGYIGFNTDLSQMEYWDGTIWVQF